MQLPSAPPFRSALAVTGGLASAWLALRLFRRHWRQWAPMSACEAEGEEEEEVPEEFLDTISLACMQDPALLCGTGQVYCLTSLRAWLATGSRTCPKTNMPMRDVQVVRLPAVRSRIAAWREAQGMPPLPPLDPPAEALAEADGVAPVQQLMAQLRCGDIYKRGLAAGAINDMLIEWGRKPPLPARQQVMEAILLDLVWLMRQGDAYGSGVAAAALAQYDAPSQVIFLAAVAAMPAVALLWSPHSYGQHSAARLLANLSRASLAMPGVLVEAGAARGLLQQLDLGTPFEYSRCSAASALRGLCQVAEGRREVRQGGGVRLLKQMVLQPEVAPPEDPGGHGMEQLLRFEKRDAADCLLALRLSAEEARQEPAVEMAALRRFRHCSNAWLMGRVAAPTEGYDAEEVAAGEPQLAAGEEGDEEEDGEWEEEEEGEEQAAEGGEDEEMEEAEGPGGEAVQEGGDDWEEDEAVGGGGAAP